MNDLPPLPEPEARCLDCVTGDECHVYSDEQIEQIRRETVLACAEAAQLVGEPPWYGYECPNTFDDGVRAAARAILELLNPLQRLADLSKEMGEEL